jgi:hypothetical protein
MSKRRVLVIGQSHTAAVMNLIRSGFVSHDVEFVVYGIHGPAFTSEFLIRSEQGMLSFQSVHVDGSEFRWFSNKQEPSLLDISDFSGVLLLDPLFIIGGFMRWQLWMAGKGICIEFLPERLALGADSLPKRFKPISSSEWLAVYMDWRKGTVKTLDVIRQLRPDIPIVLLPPAAQPKRLNTGVYPLYNRQEQNFLGEHMSRKYNAKFFLQPDCTMDEKFQTLDDYHEPAPDLHHANASYYRIIFDLIDFQTFSFFRRFP